jgi:Arc/MetJ-type ribon-helix-helix transcriptional regulator
LTENSPIGRAFALARSGHYRSVSEIIRRLRAEDREAVEAHLKDHAARRELILMCSEAWLATQ